MKSTEHWLVHDHTQIEGLLRNCREEAYIYDWWALDRYFNEFIDQLRYHMAQEEEVLFPAFDEKCQPTHELTAELLEEHDQIIECIRNVRRSIDDKAKDETVEGVERLVSLLVAHDGKEEKVLLPFASHLLYEDREELSEDLENFTMSDNSRDWGISSN
jgi:hemerythrin-like domain-containing protein